MSWLLHNVVADIYGPYFLAFYATVIVAVIVACYLSIGSVDRTRSLEPPAIPAKLDPYEVAYLRGGENEVARVAIASLIQRGLLQIIEQRTFRTQAKRMNAVGCGGSSGPTALTTFLSKTKKIDRGRKPVANELRPIEACVLKWSGFPAKPQSIFAADGIPTLLEESCFQYEEALAENNLLAPKEMKTLAVGLWLIGSALILGVGGYKLWVALVKGHSNVAFLCILGLLGLVVLAVVCLAFLPRVSQLGKAYLERLELASGRVKDPFQLGCDLDLASDIASEAGEREKAQAARAHSDGLLLLGIFGIEALYFTPLSELCTMFARGTSSGGGCGGACGGGGGGCGGGGGGGGCGGGGCGGCGG
jgi:uncharacterized protein (TIGR04222 family)